MTSATQRRAIIFRAGLLVTTVALFVSMAVSAGLGAVHYSLADVWAALRHGPPDMTSADIAPVDITLWTLRLPRIALAALVGASLAAAGVAFQSLLRNDLADPYVIGVSSGASVGAEIVLLRQGELWLGGFAVQISSFVCAIATMLLVYGIARQSGRVRVTTLLLAGVITSSFLGAISTLMLQLGPPSDTMHILGRLMGSLQDATFSQCEGVMLFFLLGFGLLLINARAMNVFALGEDSAQQLGIEIERFKTTLMIVGSLLTAAVVSVSGVIGFVGLVVPHLCRRLAGTPDHRRVLPLSLVTGALLMVWADTIARTVLPDGRELPVGLITAFLGAPFFWILLRRRPLAT